MVEKNDTPSRKTKSARFIDLTGGRFGRLGVTGLDCVKPSGSYWRCVCECGGTKSVLGAHLRSGATSSCGCLHRERTRQASGTHGATFVDADPMLRKAYEALAHAKDRCNVVGNKRYARYGGRGIEVRYKDVSDLVSDIGLPPDDSYSIDRIDNNGHYERGNCRWAQDAVQRRNNSRTIQVSINGVTKVLKDWCSDLGMPYKIVWQRIRRNGWSIERALSTPIERLP